MFDQLSATNIDLRLRGMAWSPLLYVGQQYWNAPKSGGSLRTCQWHRLVLLLVMVVVQASGYAQSVTVKYHATINDVKYVYGVTEPVAHLKPGDVIDTN